VSRNGDGKGNFVGQVNTGNTDEVSTVSFAYGGVTTGKVINLILWWVSDGGGPVSTMGQKPENVGYASYKTIVTVQNKQNPFCETHYI
jgi:hypothetical protein